MRRGPTTGVGALVRAPRSFARALVAPLAVLVLFVCACGAAPAASKGPLVRKGFIDLTAWDFREHGLVPLDGDWEFYWGRLIEPSEFLSAVPPKMDGYFHYPSRWNDYVVRGEKVGAEGVATLRIVVDHKPDERTLGVKMLNMATAYRLFGDGRLVAQNGIVSDDPRTARPQYLPQTAEMLDDDGQLEIVLQISNFHHKSGGAWHSIYLGPSALIKAFALGKAAFQVFLLGVLVVMGAYHLILYAFRPRDRSPLYFGLFSVVVAVRVLCTEEYLLVQAFPNLDWSLVVRLEFLSLYGSAPPLVAFLRTLFPHECPRFIVGITSIVTGVCGAIVLTTPPPVFTHTIVPFEVFGVAAWFAISYFLVRACLARRLGARLFAAGWVAFFVTIVNDLLGNHGVLTTITLFPVGFTFFVFVQSILLSRRFSQAIKEIAAMSRDLDRKNIELEGLNEELRRQVAERSRQLSEAMARLATEHRSSVSIAEGDILDGRYKVMRRLGAGGMGSVWAVERQSDGKHLALKVLEGERDFVALARFAREAQVAAELSHPNLVQVIDVDVSPEGRMYLVMELVEGTSLDAVDKPVVDLTWVLDVLQQTAVGLATLHAAGVVHRDLKPANVLIEHTGGRDVVKIADFGIARMLADVDMALDGCLPSTIDADLIDKWTDARAIATAQTLAAATSQPPSRQSSLRGLSSSAGLGALTQAGALLGTPLYMAPETVLDTRGAEPSSDIFSVGLIAYELLTGTLPWSEPPVITRLRGAPLAEAPSLGDAMGSLPSEVVALVDRCLALEPAARPNAQQLVQALSRLAASRSGAPLPGVIAQGTEVAESSRLE